MSAATVRAAFQTFLTTPAIPYFERCYLSEPWFAAGEQWNLKDNGGCGAIGWPHIVDESETRSTLGAPSPSLGLPASGQKEITYQVGIILLFQWLIPSTPMVEDAYIGPLDALIEGVKTRLRSDPKAGTGPGLDGVIFQQSQAAGDLHVVRDLPKLAKGGGKVIAWQRIDTTATEIVTA